MSPLVFNIHCSRKENPLVAAFNPRKKTSRNTQHLLKLKLGSLVEPLKGLPIVTDMDMETAKVKSIRQNNEFKISKNGWQTIYPKFSGTLT